MGKQVEIRWHARGGQGAKTAAILLAEAAAEAGKYIQGFPEYGPERMGAPILAFNRISDSPIRVHCNVAEPDIVVVLDPTLLGKVDVGSGLKQDGVLLVNTGMTPSQIRQTLKIQGGKIFTVDASKIALETIGRDIPNTPMMGALMKAREIFEFKKFVKITEAQLQHKFRSKKEVIEGNVKAIERAYQEVQSE